MASNPPLDLTLTPIQGEGRTLEQWLTTFHLVSVLVDPYTNESAWILDTAAAGHAQLHRRRRVG